ncbi:MAG TPA: carboxylesterase family protein [Caulobacteraceae bacterium]|jgi:para-nitrobenzyl esterase|nr:carboxylesterase family protein [Caulobacteraceae bacterium]
MDRRDFIAGASVAVAAAGSSLTASAAQSAAGPAVRTQQGVLEGIEAGGVMQFRGVPFALPPVGDLRWRAPQRAAAWSGVRPAKAFSAASYQRRPLLPCLRADGMSEDSLYLNVWTTSLSRTARQPVMVWLHGGGNLRGAGSEGFTDGSNLAKLGVTVVAPNYRLGAFGYLNDPVLGANFGFLDQVAALEWVRDNIDAFGGDPSRVLVFGYSAGAQAVRNLLRSPLAKGLFHRCVSQSGGGEPAARPAGPRPPPGSRVATERLFRDLGTTDYAALRAVPAERVLVASDAMRNDPVPAGGEGGRGLPTLEGGARPAARLFWGPVDDDKMLMSDSFPAWGPDVPAIFSHCANEGRWTFDPLQAQRSLPDDIFPPAVVEATVRQTAGANGEEALRILNAEGGGALAKLDRLFTTSGHRAGAYRALERADREGRKVFHYEFSRVSPGRRMSNRLAFHGTDVYYVFGNLIPNFQADPNHSSPDDDAFREGLYDDVDRQISREMQHAFVEFAKTGVPKRVDGAAWPQFHSESPRYAAVGDTVSFSPYRPSALLSLLLGSRHA